MAKMQVELSEALPPAWDPKDFIIPPNWAVRLVSTNCGKKIRRYPTSWVYTHHSYPAQDEDYGLGWIGEGSGDDARSSNAHERWLQGLRDQEEREHKVAIKGNLKEDQYRFWNGSQCMNSEVATCRWCRHWAYGQQAMRDHQNKTDHTRILREVYDTARRKSTAICFSCSQRTRAERWGIPLCNKHSCLNKWRVAPIGDISNTLLLYAKYARAKGFLKEWLNEDGSEKFNTETNPKSFNWERTGAY